MAYLRSKPDASLIDVFKDYPELAGPLHEFAEALMRGRSPLAAADRELIAVYVSALNGCGFCVGSHGAVAERFGVAEEAVAKARAGEYPAGLDEQRLALFRYVRKLNDSPDAIGRGDIDALYEAGWDEPAIVHATLVCGFFNLMNRWVDGLGIERDPETAEQAGRMLHEKGYAAISALLARGK